MEDFIKETLDSCREYIPRLLAAVYAVARDMQSGNEAEGIRLMPEIFDGLQWVIAAVRGMQQNGFPLEIDLAELSRCFEQLEKALAIKDYVLLADIFEYEIGPVLDDWLGTIEQCCQ